MRAQPTPPRRKWPLILIGLIAAALIAAALYAIATSRAADDAPVSAPTPTSEPTSVATGDVTGCLGGAGRDAAMLLAADASAPHTPAGAVEFAAAYVRWMHQYPNPSAAEAQTAKAAFSAVNDDFDLEGYLATQPNLSGGIVEDGRTFSSSTVNGVWAIEAASADEVTVSIGTAFVIDGQLSASLRGSVTVTVAWEDGAWRFVGSEGTRTTEDLFAAGTPFTSGC